MKRPGNGPGRFFVLGRFRFDPVPPTKSRLPSRATRSNDVLSLPRATAERNIELRAWARAYLWSIGELTLREAVDVLQTDAVRDGLVDELGQDGVQKILSDAFAAFREAAP
jgi:hypothetical protein